MARVPTTAAFVNPSPDDVRIGKQLGEMLIDQAEAAYPTPLNRRIAYANQTLGDFIDALVKLGAKLSDPLGSIEYGVSQFSSGYVEIERDEHGAWEVREVRRS